MIRMKMGDVDIRFLHIEAKLLHRFIERRAALVHVEACVDDKVPVFTLDEIAVQPFERISRQRNFNSVDIVSDLFYHRLPPMGRIHPIPRHRTF